MVAVGDVLWVTLESDTFAVAHVLGDYKGEAFYVACPDRTFNPSDLASPTDLATLVAPPYAVATITFDALVHSGKWLVLGNLVIADPPLPGYIWGRGDRLTVENFSATAQRPASQREGAVVRNRLFSSPADLEGVLRAYFGFEEWVEEYEKFRPPPAEALSAALFPEHR